MRPKKPSKIPCLLVILLAFCKTTVLVSAAQCTVDGSETETCKADSNCEEWAARGQCEKNPTQMKKTCAESCKLLESYTPDPVSEKAIRAYGKAQWIEGSYSANILAVMKLTLKYMESMKEDMSEESFKMCQNRYDYCSYWAATGACETNAEFMEIQCAPSCKTCHLIDFKSRCPPRDPSMTPGLKPGDLHNMFRTLIEDKNLKVTALSYPDSGKDSSAGQRPWIIAIDDFLSNEECSRLIELGYTAGYRRSRGVGNRTFDGTHAGTETDVRTSENAWCRVQNGCRNDEAVQRVMTRMESITGVHRDNYEDIQLLKYDVGQYYREHSDYIVHQYSRACGPRILTVFLYLSDVEEGGGTFFSKLGITVTPKKGTALVWPNVLNENPMQIDMRTFHEALPVVKGVKFAANAWIHLYDFVTPSKRGCT